MAAIQLTSLRTQVRQRADMENSGFVSDSEIDLYINASYGELYDLLVSRMEDYFIGSTTFSLTSDNIQSLPVDFYKLIGVDYLVGGDEESAITLRKFNFHERNTFSGTNQSARQYRGIPERMYRVLGESLYILPKSSAAGSYKLWYIPILTPLVEETDTMDANCDIWAEYVIVDAAIKCLIKEESDTKALMMVKAQLKQRIEGLASNRDAGDPERITDVSYDADFDSPFRGGGYF